MSVTTPSSQNLAGLLDPGRLDRLEQAVEGAEGLLELRPVDDGASPPLPPEHPGLVQVPYRLAHRVTADVVGLGELEVGGERLGELVGFESSPQVALELGPERHRTVAIQRRERHHDSFDLTTRFDLTSSCTDITSNSPLSTVGAVTDPRPLTPDQMWEAR